MYTNEYRILQEIRENFEEGPGVLIAHNIQHVANDRTYLAYIVLAFESDDSYKIHTELSRVDVTADSMTFDILSVTRLDLTAEQDHWHEEYEAAYKMSANAVDGLPDGMDRFGNNYGMDA